MNKPSPEKRTFMKDIESYLAGLITGDGHIESKEIE